MASQGTNVALPLSGGNMENEAIPELDDHNPEAQPDAEDTARHMGEGIVNAFTVERDTDLADGGGAPGGTSADQDGTQPERDR